LVLEDKILSRYRRDFNWLNIMERQAFIHGIYPRSERLITSGRGLDRGRVSLEDHKKQEREDQEALVKLQLENSLIFIEDGKFTWQDIFRPFAAFVDGLELGQLTRWFDTNTFYRQPIITDNLLFDVEKFDAFVPEIPGVNQKVTLPSPLTFARLCTDTRGVSFPKTLSSIAGLMAETTAHLEKRGIKAIQFNEPFAPYAGKEEDIDNLVKSLQEVSVKGVLSIVHLYFGDGAPFLRAFEERDSSVDIVGVDFCRTNVSDVPKDFSKALLAGVLDSQSTLIEEKDRTERFIGRLDDQIKSQSLYLTHNCDLEFVPSAIANQKIKLLGELIR